MDRKREYHFLMAHFAELDESNIVKQVLVLRNEDIDSSNEEASGATYLTNILGGIWKQTSYNNNIRFNFAGIGYTYDLVRDAFIAPNPYLSWLLDEATCRWEPPTPMPTDDKHYTWNEATTSWVEIN